MSAAAQRSSPLPETQAVPPDAGFGPPGSRTVGVESSWRSGPATYPFLEPTSTGLGQLGDYLVLRVLGSGGMGIVFLARDLSLDREVALKVIDPHAARDETTRRFFLREARAMAALEHENVVPVYCVGEANGVLFLAMPVLHGQTLEAWLSKAVRRTVPEILRVAREVAVGLAAAHEKGLVHRDIKPANIWLEEARNAERGTRNEDNAGSALTSNSALRTPRSGLGGVKILDFGLARPIKADERLTATDFVVGTPGFLAPELIQGSPPRPACDLFSLGAVLYQAFTGEIPFRGDSPLATLLATVTTDPIHISHRVPGLPPAVADLVMRLLAKNPDHRPPSAVAVAEMLAYLERGELPPENAATPTMMAATVPVPPPPANEVRPAAWVIPVVLTGVLMAMAAVAIVPKGLRSGVPATQPPPSAPVEVTGPEVAPMPRLAVEMRGPLASYGGLTSPAAGACYSPDGITFYVMAQDGHVSEWHNGKPLRPQRKWRAHAGRGFGITVAPETGRIITGGNDANGASELLGWESETLKLIYRIPAGETWTNIISVNRDGTRGVSTGLGCWAIVFDPRTGETCNSVGAAHWFSSVAISPDGTRLLSGSQWERFGRVSDVANTMLLDRLGPLPEGVGKASAFSPDGRTVALGGTTGLIRIWDADTGFAGPILEGHHGTITSLSFHPTGKRLVSGGADGTVRLWDVSTGRQIVLYHAHTDVVATVAFASHGKQFLSVGEDRQVFTWANPR